MCGIAGTWTRSDRPSIRPMLEALRHRGPDDVGQHASGQATLGHRRLSIIDCATGHQPIPSEDGSAAAIVNGEIYNANDLREELTRARHRFRTGSDSEVPLHLYEDDGPRVVEALDGMFALAIACEDALFLARDPIGIKPLYLATDGDAIAFASELKALPFDAGTVIEFPPGTWFRSDVGLQRYFCLPDAPVADLPISRWQIALRRGSVAALHNMNLQRLDRMTMAHSIEGRVPFLDVDVIELALRIPIDLKLRDTPPIEKWILRKAFEHLLPSEIVWREKTQFDEGSGTSALLPELVGVMAKRFGVASAGASSSRDLEERMYRSLFRRSFPAAAERLVARWRGSFANESDASASRTWDRTRQPGVD